MNSYLSGVIVFTLLQAGLSTLLSVLPAVFVARALVRQGTSVTARLLTRLLLIPLMLPSIAAIFGLVAIYGKNGVLPHLLSQIDVPFPSIYGMTGILLAHVFLNFPLAVRLLLQAYGQVPTETWRLAAGLNFSSYQYWRLIDWPLMRQYLPANAALVFVLCVLSFAIVLTLGGGPKATTLEVAIFQAMRFDFDPPLALELSLIQATLVGSILALSLRGSQKVTLAPQLRLNFRRYDAGGLAKLPDYMVLTIAAIFIGLPLANLVYTGIGTIDVLLTERFLLALTRTVGFCLAGAFVGAMLVWGLAYFYYRHQSRWVRWPIAGGIFFSLVVSPVMLASAVLYFLVGSPLPLPVLSLVTILMFVFIGLPFGVYAFWPGYLNFLSSYGRIAQALSLSPMTALRYVHWPLLRAAYFKAALYIALVILGDVAIVGLMGDRRVVTLAWLLYDELGAYRAEGAAAISLAMLVIGGVMIVVAERVR